MGTKHEIDNCTNCGRQFENADLISGKDLIVCRYCGHSQRNPYKVLTDKETEYLRRCNNGAVALQSYNFTLAEESFNQALEVYDGQEVSDSEMLEALWGLICSYYGIVFVKDYHEGAVKQIYCLFNLHQITPFDKKDEVNRLKSALNEVGNATIKAQYNKYMEDAENGIEQCILEQSKGYGYDYFIACKISRTTAENPNDNGITGESIEAKKLYNVLKSRGVKVFYSAIHYQSVSYDGPILSAMLRSDKMILICGSDNSEKYLKTPWVKSEWQRWRYMQKNFIKNGDSLEIFNIDESRRNKGLPPEIRDINQRFKTNENGGDVYADLINYYVEHSKSYREAEEAAEIAKAQKDKEEAERKSEEERKKREAEAEENQRKIAALEKENAALKKSAQAQTAPSQIGTAQRNSNNTYQGIQPTFNEHGQIIRNADKERTSGTCGANLTWSLDSTGTLTISGTGDMTNYGQHVLSPWVSYLVKTIVIQNGVTSIGDYAFSCCHNLTSITIPSSVTSIGDWAFMGCSYLAGITIPTGVTSIGNYAFCNCNFASITIPLSVTSIGSSAFDGCKRLTSVTIPSSVTSIGGSAFYRCEKLTSVTIPSSVTVIGDRAFENCRHLRITFEGTKEEWDNLHCDFKNVTFAKSEAINNETSGACGANLTWSFDSTGTLTISGNGAMTGWNSFVDVPWASYSSSIKTIVIQNGVTSIGDDAFWDCTSLESITIPSSVTSIGECAFTECRSLTSVTFGENSKLTSIGDGVFEDCSSLTSIIIPSSVTSIGEWAFYNCTSLKSITIPSSVTSIGEYAFRNCTSLTSITIPSSVTSIGNFAFQYCSHLTSITIPSSVTSIKSGAFSGCNNLTITYEGTKEEWDNLHCNRSDVVFSNNVSRTPTQMPKSAPIKVDAMQKQARAYGKYKKLTIPRKLMYSFFTLLFPFLIFLIGTYSVAFQLTGWEFLVALGGIGGTIFYMVRTIIHIWKADTDKPIVYLRIIFTGAIQFAFWVILKVFFSLPSF